MLNQQESMPTYFHNVFCCRYIPAGRFGLGWYFSRFLFKLKIAPLTNPPQLCLVISSYDSLSVIRIVYDGRVIFTIIIWALVETLLQLSTLIQSLLLDCFPRMQVVQVCKVVEQGWNFVIRHVIFLILCLSFWSKNFVIGSVIHNYDDQWPTR